MKTVMAANVAAYEQTVRSTIALAGTLGEGEWGLPTECTGWNVKDIVAHMGSVEVMLLGEDPAPGHVVPDGLTYVRNDLGRVMEMGVDFRRAWPAARVVAELADALDRRLDAVAGIDPEQPTVAPTGQPVTYAEFMGFRAFDLWTHEQDVRRAVDRPGNLDAPATDATRHIVVPGLVTIARRAGAGPGRSVSFHIGGPVEFSEHVVFDADGRGALADPSGTADTTLWMDWETFVRLVAGRCGPDDVEVRTSGDTEFAARVVAAMALTP